MTKDDFANVMSEKNANAIAECILERFGPTDPSHKRLLDYDFNVSKGVMVPSKGSNTVLAFDFLTGDVGRQVVAALADEDLVVTAEIRAMFSQFLNLIESKLMERTDDLKRAISKAVFLDENYPLAAVRVNNVVIMDLPEIDFILLINKAPCPQGTPAESLQSEVIAEWQKDKADFDTILKRLQDRNPKFLKVSSIETRKAFFECEVRMYIDYSLVCPVV